MDFLELAKKRKTTYDFDEKPVSQKDINTILEAARWAPSCSNSQPWNFIVVKNKKTIEKLMTLVNYGDFHTEPTLVIAIVLRRDLCPGEDGKCFRGDDSGVHDSFMSCGIAASHMTLAATDLGINNCIITPEQVAVRKLLKVSKDDFVPLVIGFGHQKKETFQKKRERRPLKDSVHKEYLGGK